VVAARSTALRKTFDDLGDAKAWRQEMQVAVRLNDPGEAVPVSLDSARASSGLDVEFVGKACEVSRQIELEARRRLFSTEDLVGGR